MRKLFVGVLSCLITASLVACNNESAAPVEPEEETEQVEVTTEDEAEEEEGEGIDHHDDLPFEWGASFTLEVGTYTLVFNENEHGDESMLLAFILENSNITDLEHHAAHIMEEDADGELINEGEQFEAKHEFAYNLSLNTNGSSTFTFTISESGSYTIFTEHHADEFQMQILNEVGEEIEAVNPTEYEGHGHSHSH